LFYSHQIHIQKNLTFHGFLKTSHVSFIWIINKLKITKLIILKNKYKW
jgi:hypothetical protein